MINIHSETERVEAYRFSADQGTCWRHEVTPHSSVTLCGKHWCPFPNSWVGRPLQERYPGLPIHRISVHVFSFLEVIRWDYTPQKRRCFTSLRVEYLKLEMDWIRVGCMLRVTEIIHRKKGVKIVHRDWEVIICLFRHIACKQIFKFEIPEFF
jgi:hypothetical protein